VIALRAPALPVLAVGLALAGVAVLRRQVRPAVILGVVNPAVLCGLFGVAVGLGALARVWTAPQSLLSSAGRWGTAAIGAAASVAVNNLPAAVLFAPHMPPHPRALLLGLNLGPSLAVTGSLSAVLWMQVARRAEATPNARTYSLIGIVLAPLSIAAALALTVVFAPAGF
jgi:arsenical pump membrane protein